MHCGGATSVGALLGSWFLFGRRGRYGLAWLGRFLKSPALFTVISQDSHLQLKTSPPVRAMLGR
jgi:hypothetical protein